MNIYDNIPIKCIICETSIGEVEYDAEIIRPKCGQCANPTPKAEDTFLYTTSAIKAQTKR